MSSRHSLNRNSSHNSYNEKADSLNESMAEKLSRLSQKSLDSRTRSDPNSRPVGLKKSIGLFSGVALIVGTMIGSGIFISPTGVTENSGSVGLSLILWLIGGIISLLGAMSYAELGTTIRKSGGEYSYLLSAFGPLNKHVGNIPAFLFAWVNMMLLKPASVAIITLTFATYCMQPFYDVCSPPASAKRMLAILCVLIILLINSVSIKVATWIQNIFTVTKLVAVVIIVFTGFVLMGMGYTQYISTGFSGTATSAGSIAVAIYHSMWAYDGWNNLNYVTEEVIDYHRNLPRAILIAVPLVTVCYLFMNLSYFTMMSVKELIQSPAVAVTWGNRTLGVMSWLIPLFVACSTFGAANGTLFSSGRLNYVAAREGHMLKLLAMVQVKTCSPMPSLIFTCLLAIIFIIPGDISSLIDFFSFAVWLFYGLTMVALIIIRLKLKPEKTDDTFKVPIIIPFIVLVVSLFLVVAPIIDKPRIEYLYAFLFIIGGLIFYIPFVHFKKELPGMEKFNAFFSLLLDSELPHREET
ncbi:hypothetical protein LSH36_35g08111 [Paralvinella palmiformis]|uniref:b(0,+)-type amino acid transporter 1 n=1 Tax=Paralvinella palmiformis TaxID=53620 RepID=A0AAD9NFM1_9ANNE|nr:hypothetical protein LSH36_35g08111 [Paralvinella palmiformis]